jgi:hypothetical protein
MRISKHSRRFDLSTADLRKQLHVPSTKKKEKKSSDGLLTIKMTCAKLIYFLLIITVYVMFE